jgi:hypothetical protein
MTSIGLHRLLAGCGARFGVGGVMHRNPTNGRQGKSAASGQAQVVGWVETFVRSNAPAGWRFTAKHERIQRLQRHRTLLHPVFSP